MHDPQLLLYEVPGIRLDIWHREPGGHDAATVCGHPQALVALHRTLTRRS